MAQVALASRDIWNTSKDCDCEQLMAADRCEARISGLISSLDLDESEILRTSEEWQANRPPGQRPPGTYEHWHIDHQAHNEPGTQPWKQQHRYTLGRGELGVTVFFLILPFALLNSSEIKWVWHLRKLQFVIARFSELLIHGNNLVFTIEIIFAKNVGLFLFEFREQVSVRVMKRLIISYIPHYIRKFLRI